MSDEKKVTPERVLVAGLVDNLVTCDECGEKVPWIKAHDSTDGLHDVCDKCHSKADL